MIPTLLPWLTALASLGPGYAVVGSHSWWLTAFVVPSWIIGAILDMEFVW